MKRKKNAVLISILVVSALVLVAAIGYLIFEMINIMSAKNENDALAASFAGNLGDEDYTGHLQNNGPTTPEQIDHTVAERVTNIDNPVSFEELRAINPDVYAWIYIPDTNINYPVLQSPSDDNFYLSHNVYKSYSFPGAIYSQKSYNKTDWSDRVTVLYGHNMASGAMFANLHKFEDKSFFDSHPYIYIYGENRKLVYQVVSAYAYDDIHILNSYDFSDDKVFKSWLEDAKNPHSMNSNVRSGVQLDLKSKMLVLSTCPNNSSGRFLVQGVLVKDEQTKQ